MGGWKNSGCYITIQSVQDDVTGSRTLISITFPNKENVLLLVDCGLYQGSAELEERNGEFEFDCKHLDAVFLTHPHVDHCGQLPLLYVLGADCKTYMAQDTLTIAEILLGNTTAIVSTRKKPYWKSEDLQKALKEFRAVEYNSWEEVKIKNKSIPGKIEMMFIRNEHIPGSASIFFKISNEEDYMEDCLIGFSGDYNEVNHFSGNHTTIGNIPQEILEKPITFFLMEATHGVQSKEEVEFGKFKNDIVKYIAEGKKIFSTAFAYGRMQTILLILKQLQDDGLLSVNIPIYLDGNLGISITKIFANLETAEIKDFMPKNVTFVLNEEMRANIITSSKQAIIISTSGMGNFGPAKEYITAFISNPNVVIYIPGYAAEGTISRKILEASEGEVVDIKYCENRIKRAITETTLELSSHGYLEDYVKYIGQFSKIKFLVFNHGSRENREKLQEYFEEKVNNVGIVKYIKPEVVYVCDTKGYKKEFSSKSIPLHVGKSK